MDRSVTDRKFHAVMPATILLLGLGACAQTSPKTTTVYQKPTIIEVENLAGTLVSGVTYEIHRNKQAEPAGEQSPSDLDKTANQTATWLTVVTREELTRRGLRVDSGASNAGAHAAARCVRTNLDAAEIQDLVHPVCLSRRAGAVLCQHMAVKPGSEAGWGAKPLGLGVRFVPMAGTSSVYFRAVIRDCQSAEERWRGEVYYRGTPDVENKEFEESIRGVFRTLSFKETRQ
jgi:hypothetical protein